MEEMNLFNEGQQNDVKLEHDGVKLYSIDGNVFKYKTWETPESKVRNIKLSTDKFEGFGNFRDYGYQLSGNLKGNSDHGSYYNTTVEKSIRAKAKEHFKVMAYACLMDNSNCYYSIIKDRQYNDIDNKYINELVDLRVKEYSREREENFIDFGTGISNRADADKLLNNLYSCKRIVRNQVFVENILSIDFEEDSITMNYKGNNYDLSDALYLNNLCYHHNALVLAAYGFNEIQAYINFCRDIRDNYEDEFDDNNSEFYRNLDSYLVK